MCLGCFYIYDIGSRTEAGYSAIFFKPESVGKIFPQPKANSQIDDGFNYSTTGKTPGGGTLEISGWGCAAGTLEPLTYTRASSAEFCHPILE